MFTPFFAVLHNPSIREIQNLTSQQKEGQTEHRICQPNTILNELQKRVDAHKMAFI